jgi:hypothetical protein
LILGDSKLLWINIATMYEASRDRSFDGLRFYVSEYNGQGHLANDGRVFTKNIVYTELLNH